MRKWLLDRWNDDAKFIATCRALIAALGALFALDMIPTGIDGAGPKIAAFLNSIAFGMAAGDKSPAEKE